MTHEFLARFGVDMTEPIKVRFIRMSRRVVGGLDYPSKLSRQPGHIDRLIADGVAQAKAFLAELDAGLAPSEPSAAQAVLGDASLH